MSLPTISEMTELLDRDILKHVADSGILDMKRLHPILQCRLNSPVATCKLLKKVYSEAGVGVTHADGLNQLFAVLKT